MLPAEHDQAQRRRRLLRLGEIDAVRDARVDAFDGRGDGALEAELARDVELAHVLDDAEGERVRRVA